MKKFLVSALTVGMAASVVAGVYDDAEYLFRGLYNHQGSKVPATAVVDDYEFYNALGAAKGIWTKPDHYAIVAGVRDHVRPVVTDVVNPLTGRIQKNRSTIRFAQTTYKNPGDDTLYGDADGQVCFRFLSDCRRCDFVWQWRSFCPCAHRSGRTDSRQVRQQ